MTSGWQTLAAGGCHLFWIAAQRAAASRSTIRQFLEAARKGAVRVFDVKPAAGILSTEILTESMKVQIS